MKKNLLIVLCIFIFFGCTAEMRFYFFYCLGFQREHSRNIVLEQNNFEQDEYKINAYISGDYISYFYFYKLKNRIGYKTYGFDYETAKNIKINKYVIKINNNEIQLKEEINFTNYIIYGNRGKYIGLETISNEFPFPIKIKKGDILEVIFDLDINIDGKNINKIITFKCMQKN